MLRAYSSGLLIKNQLLSGRWASARRKSAGRWPDEKDRRDNRPLHRDKQRRRTAGKDRRYFR